MYIYGNINKISSYDNEHLRQIIEGASFDVLQMDPGQFEAQLFNLSLVDNALDGGFYRKKTLTVGTFAPDVVTFGLIHGLDNYGIINGRDVTELDLTVAVDGSEMECYFHEDTHWSTYQISLEDSQTIQCCQKQIRQAETPVKRGMGHFARHPNLRVSGHKPQIWLWRMLFSFSRFFWGKYQVKGDVDIMISKVYR